MDVLKFLEQGNVTSNPEYNPKTKKGAIQPPYLVDNTPGASTSDEGRSVLGRTLARNTYNLNQYDVDKYSPYKVYVNPFDTEEELNRERAENQSVMEQTGRFLGQAVGSEVVLGTLRGFSDLVDAAGRLVGVADDDYTNPVSEQLAQMQDAVRERFEIYRKDPNATFDVSDTGWWLGNAVSIASTASLLIPGLAASKLGRLVGLNRLTRGIGKVAGTPFGKANTWGKAVEAGSEIMGTAAVSRVAENYIEARDTYTQVYDEAKDVLANMSDKDRERFYKSNPKLQGLDDEAIAKYISGESADETFTNDMWLMLMDAWQLKGLKNIWKGAKNAASTRALRDANEEAAARLVGREITKPTGIKKYLRMPDKEGALDILRESSEAFEEGYQYIQSQVGIDKGRKMLNDKYVARSANDYARDEHMWEQAFWGWLGGIGFQAIGSGAGRVYNKLANNKDMLVEARKAEIDSRASVIDNYINNMNILNNNLNPNAPILDDNGQQVINSDGSASYEELSDTERDALKQAETERLVTDLTIAAIDKGNYDLLKDFLNTEDVSEYMDKSGVIENGESKAFLANINAKMAEVSELYERELSKAISNDAKDANIAGHIAKENTYNRLASKAEQKLIDGYTADYNMAIQFVDEPDLTVRAAELDKSIRLEGYKAEIDYLNKQLATNDANLKAKKINKIEHSHIDRKINKKKQAFIRAANATDETSFNAIYNENRNPNATRELAEIEKNLVEAVYGRSMAERRKVLTDSDIADTNRQIRDKAKYIENQFKIIADEAFKDNLNRLDNAFESNDIDAVVEYLSGNKDVELDDNVKSELDDIGKNLRLFDETSEPFVDVVSRRARLKSREKGERATATVNNEPVDFIPPVAQTEDAKPTETETETNKDDANPSSTGEQEKPDPAIVVDDGTTDKEDAEISSVLAKQEEAMEKQFNATSEINNYLLDNLLRSPNEELVGLDYDAQYTAIKNEFINQGYTAEIIDSILPRELRSLRGLLERIQNVSEDEHDSNLDIVIGRILSSEDAARADYFRNLIDIYKANNNILSINGKDYFNIISLMRFVINESNATFETVNQLYNELSTYLLSGVDENLVNINPRDVALSRDKLIELVQEQELTDPELDNNVGTDKINNDGRIAIANMKVGQELTAVSNKYGVEFWTTVDTPAGPMDVKVGFNNRARKTVDNDGYTFDNGYLTYNIYYGEDGYSSDLDSLFDALNPENGQIGDDAKQFIDALYKNRANRLTQEDIDAFWRNPLTKELLNNVKNKNTNNDNAVRLLDAIGNIYLYSVSDNLNDNYDSYLNWIAKQYNNYKMVDTISKNDGNVRVTVRYASKGQAVFSETTQPEDIDKAIVGFNYDDYHLGIVAADSEIHDSITGTVRIKAGFRNRNVVVIVPNGANEPFYAKVIPQGLDTSAGLAQAIRKEIVDSISDRQQGNIGFDELRDRLTSIFGIKNFVDGVNCVEYDNRIIIATAGSTIPMLTIYKFKNNSTEVGTGITLNPKQVSGAGVGRTGWGGTLEQEINEVVDALLGSSVYSMSHGIANGTTNNRYVTKGENGSFSVKFGGTEFSYGNYLQYIVDNKAGKIRLGQTNIGGTKTNFNPNPPNSAGKQKLRVEYEVLRPVEDGENIRHKAITAIEQQGNQTNVVTNSIVKAVAPDFVTSGDQAILNGILPDTVNIDTNDAETRYAVYNSATDTITLFKPFFGLARNNQYKAVRTLAHEQLHRRIFSTGIMNSRKFLDEIIDIRNQFVEALNNPDANAQFNKFIEDNRYDKEKYIEQLRKVVDPANFEGRSENYMLEEFIVESLTNNVLNDALNNITSTKEVSAETKRPSLWQKVINLIRELFGFNQIQDNTLLAQEFKAFGQKFKDVDSVQQKIEQEAVDEVTEETTDTVVEETETINVPTINETESTAAELAQDADDSMTLDVNVDDMFSAIDITGDDFVVPNMNAIRAGLTSAERTEFDASLVTGDTQIYCR